jgi:hypothetical protein
VIIIIFLKKSKSKLNLDWLQVNSHTKSLIYKLVDQPVGRATFNISGQVHRQITQATQAMNLNDICRQNTCLR